MNSVYFVVPYFSHDLIVPFGRELSVEMLPIKPFDSVMSGRMIPPGPYSPAGMNPVNARKIQINCLFTIQIVKSRIEL